MPPVCKEWPRFPSTAGIRSRVSKPARGERFLCATQQKGKKKDKKKGETKINKDSQKTNSDRRTERTEKRAEQAWRRDQQQTASKPLRDPVAASHILSSLAHASAAPRDPESDEGTAGAPEAQLGPWQTRAGRRRRRDHLLSTLAWRGNGPRRPSHAPLSRKGTNKTHSNRYLAPSLFSSFSLLPFLPLFYS